MGYPFYSTRPLILVVVTLILLVVAAGCGSDVQVTTEPTPTEPTEAGASDSSPLESGNQTNGGVDVLLGRAILLPDESAIVFYVGRNTREESEGPVIKERANLQSSGATSWPSYGHGEVLHGHPLTLGWLRFPVAVAPAGSGSSSLL